MPCGTAQNKKQTSDYNKKEADSQIQRTGYQWGEESGKGNVGVRKKGFMGLYEIMCVNLENCKVL